MPQFLDNLKRKFIQPHRQHEPPPAKAHWTFPSMVYDPADDTPPSPRLLQLALAAARLANDSIDLSDLDKRPQSKVWLNVWPGEHYKLLAALVQILKPRTVIEIGTAEGLSSCVMKKYLPPGGKLVTFDIIPWNKITDTFFVPQDFEDGRLAQEIGDLADRNFFEKCRPLIESAELFFIDGPKDNVFEYKLLDYLRTVNFANPPILLFDDIRLWSMLKFWRQVKMPKLDLITFGHSSGSGLIDWQP